MDHTNDNSDPKIEIVHITLVDEEEDISPPGEIYSDYNSVHEWLSALCDKERPAIKIATYEFGLFQSDNKYFAYLAGKNTHTKNENHTVTTIDFEPTDMYFPLAGVEYTNLSTQQVWDRLKQQLKDFIKTEKFKPSFFVQAETIKTSFDGDMIWSK